MSVGKCAIASYTAGMRTTEMDGQAQMRIESMIEPVLLGEMAVKIFSNVCRWYQTEYK